MRFKSGNTSWIHVDICTYNVFTGNRRDKGIVQISDVEHVNMSSEASVIVYRVMVFITINVFQMVFQFWIGRNMHRVCLQVHVS